MKTFLHKLTAVVVTMALSGCTFLQDAQAKVDAFVVKNQAAITNACENDILPVVNNPAVTVVGGIVGAALGDPVAVAQVANAQAALTGLCKSAEAIASAAQSVTTLPWAATALTVIKSGGKVLPAPIAPVQAAPDTIPATDPKLPTG